MLWSWVKLGGEESNNLVVLDNFIVYGDIWPFTTICLYIGIFNIK